jgi:hypothetical protein
MHVNISQEALFTEIYRKNAAAQLEHPDQAPAFTTTVRRILECRHTVWGKNIVRPYICIYIYRKSALPWHSKKFQAQ